MRKIREVLRLHYDLKLGEAADCAQRPDQREHSARPPGPFCEKWAELADAVRTRRGRVYAAMFPAEPALAMADNQGWPAEEYPRAHREGYGYSGFCHYYQQWKQQRDLVMRQEHSPGERLFV